jgi:hypothetical protein
MKMYKKIFNKILKNIKKLNELLITIFVFSVVSGLLFNDPFGVIGHISKLISDIGDNGISGLISLLVIVLWYRR